MNEEICKVISELGGYSEKSSTRRLIKPCERRSKHITSGFVTNPWKYTEAIESRVASHRAHRVCGVASPPLWIRHIQSAGTRIPCCLSVLWNTRKDWVKMRLKRVLRISRDNLCKLILCSRVPTGSVTLPQDEIHPDLKHSASQIPSCLCLICPLIGLFLNP